MLLSRCRYGGRHLLLGAALALGVAGCESMSPSNLWKLNRHPPIGDDDAYFSVPNDAIEHPANPWEDTENSEEIGSADAAAR